jgi:hypothetical protein
VFHFVEGGLGVQISPSFPLSPPVPRILDTPQRNSKKVPQSPLRRRVEFEAVSAATPHRYTKAQMSGPRSPYVPPHPVYSRFAADQLRYQKRQEYKLRAKAKSMGFELIPLVQAG